MDSQIDPTREQRAPAWKLALVLGVAAAGCALLLLHVRGVNGPSYWVWKWRRLDAAKWYPAMLAAAAPFFVGQLVSRRLGERAAKWMLSLAMLSWFAMAMVACCWQVDPIGLPAIYQTVVDGNANGYFIDARYLVTHLERGEIDLHTFLTKFAEIMPMLSMHVRIRPPGNLLFYVPFHKLCASEWSAAIASSMVIALLASLSIPATWLLVRELTGSTPAALMGACYLSLCPGFVLFFPTFDIVYPAASAVLIVIWLRAVRRRRVGYAVAFGAMLAAICFSTFNLLVLGVFLAGITVLHLRSATERMRDWKWAATCILAAIATFAMAWFLLWLFTGFDIVATFKVALKDQAEWNQGLNRPFPATVPWDLYDFLLGSGFISAAIIAMGWKNWRRSGSVAIVLLCLAQPALIAGLGLLQTETARVWLFMQPLIMAPIGLELANWSWRQRAIAFAALLAITMVIGQNMWLLGWTTAIH